MESSKSETKSTTIKIGSKISVANQKCCIANCKLWKTKAKSLHPIPSHSPMVQMRWFNFIRQSRGLTWTPKDDHNVPLICSLHFSDKSYIANSNKLKPNACPIFEDSKLSKKRSQCHKRSENIHQKVVAGVLPTKHAKAIPGHRSTNEVKHCIVARAQPISDSIKIITVPVKLPYHEVPSGTETTFTSTQPIFVTKLHVPQSKSTVAQPSIIGTQPLASKPSSTSCTKQSGQTIPILPSFCSQLPLIVLPASGSGSHSNVVQASIFQSASVHTPMVGLGNLSHVISPDSCTSTTPTSKTRPPLPSRFIPSKMGFCLVCDKNIESLEPFEKIDEADIVKSRNILLKMLNFNVENGDVNDSYPICLQCNYKVLDLQNSLDKLIKQQEEMESQRNYLLKEIVKTFCKRMSTTSGSIKFVSADAVHAFITKKWASTLHPPYPKYDPIRERDVNIVKEIIAERKRKTYEKRRELTLENRLAFYDKQNLSRQKREEKLQRIEENKLRRLRGEKVKRSKKRCLERMQCPVCSIELLKISLKNHMQTHTGELKHQCDLCGRAFLREANLRTHRQTHVVGGISFGRSDRNYECEICKKVLHSGKRYNRHIVIEHMTPKNVQDQVLIEPTNKTVHFYDCDDPTCNLSISNLKEFQQHLLLHSNEPIKCPVEGCSKQFASSSGLSIHEQFHESCRGASSSTSTSIFHDCPYCHEYFNSDQGYQTHRFFHEIRIDPQAFKFICDECGSQYVTEIDLEVHKKDRHRRKESIRLGGNKKSYQMIICEVCGVAFNAESRLRMHSYIHTHPEGFPCEKCKKIFSNPTKLYFHTKRQDCSQGHDQEEDIITKEVVDTEINGSDTDCLNINTSAHEASINTNVVVQNAETQDYIKKSKQWRFNPISKKATSRKMKKTEPTSKSKPKSVKKRPASWRPLTCKHCDFISRGSMYLYRRHLLLHHPEIYVDSKEFFCHVCWLNYATDAELSEHFKIHDRYRCKICGKILGNIVRLHQHQRTHTGEKPYECKHCPKKFSLEVNLREHELRHTGERPYKCLVCQAGFFRKKQMTQHMQRLHEDKKQYDDSDSVEDDAEAVGVVATSVEVGVGIEPVVNNSSQNVPTEESKSQLQQNPLIDFSNFLIAPTSSFHPI